MNVRGVATSVLTLALLAWLAPASAHARSADSPSLLFELRVPGGVGRLASAAHLRAAPPPSLALLPLIRALHGNRVNNREEIARRDALVAALHTPPAPGEDDDLVPLPLPPETWISIVFANKVAPENLLEAILTDRRAALLYYGLMSLDEPTLAFFSTHTPLLSAMLEQGVAVFAVHGRAIQVRNGAMVLPGGARGQALWEAIVGEPAGDAARFIPALLNRDIGRCVYFYDTVSHLDRAGQAFALGLAQPSDLVSRFRRLYSVFRRFEADGWRLPDVPFVQRPNDPALVLMRLAATGQGELAPPASQALWKAVFDGNAGTCRRLTPASAGPPAADAAWLLDRLFEQPADRRMTWLDTIAFAQRTFAAAPSSGAAGVCETLVAFPTYQGLLLTLDAIDGFGVDDYVSVLRQASTLRTGDDTVYSAELQGALEILRLSAAANSLSRHATHLLVRSLFSVNAEPRIGDARRTPLGMPITRSAAPGYVATWMVGALLPALNCTVQSADDCVAGAVGGPAAFDRPVIAWEGERYRIDYRASSRERARRVRARQQSNLLTDVLAMFEAEHALLAASISPPEAQRQAAILKDVSGRLTAPQHFGFGTSDLRDTVEKAVELATVLARPGARPPDRASRVERLTDLLALDDALLADALTSFVYAIAIGDAESSLLLAGDPARRHDFGSAYASIRKPNGPWRVAEERHMPDGTWLIQGSLLGVNRVIAQFAVRRLSVDTEAVPPTLEARDVRALADSALALNPFALTDGDRGRLLDAIRRARSRLPGLLMDPDAYAAASEGIGISEWRAAAARWTVRQSGGRVEDLFSLAELFWLGLQGPGAPAIDAAGLRALDQWGAATREVDGAWALRLPRGHSPEDFCGRIGGGRLGSLVADLHLRIGECLEQLQLPSALVPGIAAYAVWDLTMRAQMADLEDWLAVIRAARSLSADQVADYVSALTAPDGPLVPIK